MKTTVSLMLVATLTGCGTSASWMPLASQPPPQEDAKTLVWVGRGECERMENGIWVRRPEFDYSFSVEQHRRGLHWESVKSMRRLHPRYDLSAGPRTQTYFFRQDFERDAQNGQVAGKLQSSLGEGGVHADQEFRSVALDFKAAGVSSFAPFDRYHITQSYKYEDGELTEIVELKDGETPWVRNHETAKLFSAQKLTEAPTRLATVDVHK